MQPVFGSKRPPGDQQCRVGTVGGDGVDDSQIDARDPGRVQVMDLDLKARGHIHHEAPSVEEQGHRTQRHHRIRDRTRQAQPARRRTRRHRHPHPLTLNLELPGTPPQRHQRSAPARIAGLVPGAFAFRGLEARRRVAAQH
jgi:hypothetical protein